MQAKIQGMFAAHAMAGKTDAMAFGFNFELFTHITQFCGRKVVLLGLYNGQGLQHEPDDDMVTYSRTTEVKPVQHLTVPLTVVHQVHASSAGLGYTLAQTGCEAVKSGMQMSDTIGGSQFWQQHCS